MARWLVLYDGTCGLCRGSRRGLERLDWLKQFEWIPYQDAEVQRRAPGLDPNALAREMHVLSPQGRIYRGADALGVLFRRAPLLWPLGAIMWLPPVLWLARKLYPIIARNRLRIASSCPWPNRRG